MITDSDNGSQIVPMGKYKGKPIETVLADDDYCRWLTAQGWFRDNPRYTNLYQTIINYGGQPQDSPEHNALQAQFLGEQLCLKLAGVVTDIDFDADKYRVDLCKTARKLPFSDAIVGHLRVKSHQPAIHDIQFEVDGWDVLFTVKGPGAEFEVTSMPPCACGDCPHKSWDSDCAHEGHTREARESVPKLHNGYRVFFGVNPHCDPKCFYYEPERVHWITTIQATSPSWERVHVECKPTLGDDYPTVLRQVTRYKCDSGVKCVVVGELQPTSVTAAQVKAIYKASGIKLVLLAEVNREGSAQHSESGTSWLPDPPKW